MDETILFLNVGFLIGCVASALVSVWYARKNNVRELENDVSEIASVVEKIYKESKRAQMQRVRAAAGDSDIPRPPGLVADPPLPQVANKDALRRMVFGGKRQ
jgi:hypothetical protein